MESNKSMRLGPFFCDYTTDNRGKDSQEVDPSWKNIWEDEHKEKAMKSLWKSDTTTYTGMEARGRGNFDSLPFVSCWTPGLSDVDLIQPFRKLPLGSCLDSSVDLLMDKELSKMFPRVKTPPPGILFNAASLAGRELNENLGSNFTSREDEDEATAMGACGGYEKPSYLPFELDIQQCDTGFLDAMIQQSTDILDFKKPITTNRKFSIDSSDSGVSSLRSVPASYSDSNDLNSSSYADLENISNVFAQNQDDEDLDEGNVEGLFGRLEKELVLGFEETDLEDSAGAEIERPRTGTTRADMDEFAKKFGYATQPRTSFLYRPRKGKYRKEF